MSPGSISTTFGDLGRHAILNLWQQHGAKARLGLAISGGVDSMALATLCSSIQNTGPVFTGFIVDHGLREDSSAEAEKVAAELKRLDIQPHIVKLDRSAFATDAGTGSHLEKTARVLRYRAIGTACYEQGIGSLLVAHHADDQAETVLQRITQNYLGNGLSGIKAEAGIPHCEDLYGVYESGGLPTPLPEHAIRHSDGSLIYKILRETGGVKILRPLLPATKSQLISLCEQSGTKWFEDHTNADVSLATRNTLRQLHKEELLPMALRRTSLFALASRLSRRMKEIERIARAELDRTDVLLDLRTGKAAFTVSRRVFADFRLPPDVEYNAKAVLLRMLIGMVSPDAQIELAKLHAAVDMVYPNPEKGDEDLLFQDSQAQVCVGGTRIRRAEGMTGFLAYTIRRDCSGEEPSGLHIAFPQATEADVLDAPKWTTSWQFWDNRYWIRLGSMQRDVIAGRRFIVRRYSPDDRKTALKAMSSHDGKAFMKALAEAAGRSRYTIPLITEQHEDGRETILALPTLGWRSMDCESWPTQSIKASDQRLVYDIRYKKLGFSRNHDRHEIINHLPRSRRPMEKPSLPTEESMAKTYWQERVRHMIARRQRSEAGRVSTQRKLREFIGMNQSRRRSPGRRYMMEKRERSIEVTREKAKRTARVRRRNPAGARESAREKGRVESER